MKHALVVGGTGMLKELTLWLVAEGYHVSVVARTEAKILEIANESCHPSVVTPLSVDYRNENLLDRKLKETIEQNGPITLAVTWIHNTAPKALELIINAIDQANTNNWRLFQVCGSNSNLTEIKSKVNPPENCLYRQVQLGLIIENGKSRWLTNEEISNGVIEAIKSDGISTVVGTLCPWELRP